MALESTSEMQESYNSLGEHACAPNPPSDLCLEEAEVAVPSQLQILYKTL